MPFVEVLVRQAHPGPDAGPYRDIEQKFADAKRYVREEEIPWTVVVDDLAGSVHQVYGGLADPSYLIDSDGLVSFYNTWTHAPTLNRAIEALLEQNGRGIVNGGVDRRMHMLPAMTSGWSGLRRGLPQSFIDLETAAPGMASGVWLGYQLRPLLAPISQRAEPMSTAQRLALTVAGTAALLGVAAIVRRQRAQASTDLAAA